MSIHSLRTFPRCPPGPGSVPPRSGGRWGLGTTLLAGAAAMTGACIDTDGGADQADRQTLTFDNIVVSELAPATDPPTTPAPLTTDGTYQLVSTLDVEAQALLPGTAYEAVQILEGLRDRPAQTMFDLAEAAGVPYVADLRAALPSALESRLYGWIDGYVQGVTTGDGTIAQVIDTVVGVCHADVAHVELGSTLAIALATGDGVATHRLDTVTLEVQGRLLSYDVAPLAAIGAELQVPVTASVGAAGELTIGGHGFGLPYGKIAWRAIEDQVMATYGRDLRTLLGDQVNCAAMAASVASNCVLSVCVGHATELDAICEAGLDRAVLEVRNRVEAATVEPIALDGGTATLVDGDFSDHVASAVDAGVWSARLDIGNGLRSAPATFTGARE